ncbi:reverse transcriptase domain-containing protein, partial [Tanacetum coccineum]
MIQVRLNVPVRMIRTDNGTEFVNQTLWEYYEEVGISLETSMAQTPQHNGVIERRNRTHVEAARTMLIFTQAPLFLWAKAVATACYIQNRSLLRQAVTFNLDQTLRYSSNYDDMMANRIDVIKMACEEYSQEVLSFSNVIAIDAFLALDDDPTSPEINDSYCDPEGNILILEAFLTDDPSLPPPTQGNYLPKIRKKLKICEAKNDKSSIDEPPKVELKDVPPHLEYAFLEGDDKLPVIIA